MVTVNTRPETANTTTTVNENELETKPSLRNTYEEVETPTVDGAESFEVEAEATDAFPLSTLAVVDLPPRPEPTQRKSKRRKRSKHRLGEKSRHSTVRIALYQQEVEQLRQSQQWDSQRIKELEWQELTLNTKVKDLQDTQEALKATYVATIMLC